MGKQILVPLKREDRMEELITYVEEIIQPGMEVRFLVRYDSGFGMALWAGHLAESTVRDSVAIGQIHTMYSQEDQQQAVAAKVFRACDSLRKKGAEITVNIYTGSLRGIVRSHIAGGDVHLVVTRSGIGPVVGNVLRRAASAFGLRRAGYRPVHLVHPSAVR